MCTLKAHVNKILQKIYKNPTLTNLFLEKFYWELKKLSKLFQFLINFFQNWFIIVCPKGTHISKILYTILPNTLATLMMFGRPQARFFFFNFQPFLISIWPLRTPFWLGPKKWHCKVYNFYRLYSIGTWHSGMK